MPDKATSSPEIKARAGRTLHRITNSGMHPLDFWQTLLPETVKKELTPVLTRRKVRSWHEADLGCISALEGEADLA